MMWNLFKSNRPPKPHKPHRNRYAWMNNAIVIVVIAMLFTGLMVGLLFYGHSETITALTNELPEGNYQAVERGQVDFANNIMIILAGTVFVLIGLAKDVVKERVENNPTNGHAPPVSPEITPEALEAAIKGVIADKPEKDK